MPYEFEWSYRKGLDYLCDAIRFSALSGHTENSYAHGRIESILAMLHFMDLRVTWKWSLGSSGHHLYTITPKYYGSIPLEGLTAESLWKHYLESLGEKEILIYET